MNEFSFIGRAGRDPELRFTDDGKAVANISMAVSKGKNIPPIWYEMTAWDKTAEILHSYVHKGNQFGVVGRIKQNEWQDRETGEKRSGMTIQIEKLDLLTNQSDQSKDDAF